MPPNAPTRVLLEWSDGDASDTIVVDASISENHQDDAEVQDHPVEDGINISDGIRPLPRKLVMELLVTNHPVYPLGTQMDGATAENKNVEWTTPDNKTVKFQAMVFDQAFDRVRQVHRSLTGSGTEVAEENSVLGAIERGALFRITTSLKQYENMAAESMSVRRDASNGNALRFTIGFKLVRVVSTESIATDARKKKPKKRGNQAPKPADEKTTTDNRGFTKKVAEALGGLLQR